MNIDLEYTYRTRNASKRYAYFFTMLNLVILGFIYLATSTEGGDNSGYTPRMLDAVSPIDLHHKKDIFSQLSYHIYKGKWTSDNRIHDFDNNEGIFRLAIQRIINYRTSSDIIYNYVIFLNDGEYKTKWLYMRNRSPIDLNTTGINITPNATAIVSNNALVGQVLFHSFELVMRRGTVVDIAIEAESDHSGELRYTNITGSIKFQDKSVNIDFAANIDYVGLLKISNFSICLSIISLLQLFNSKNLMEYLEANPSEAKKVRGLTLTR
jgi:hypothetical protein